MAQINKEKALEPVCEIREFAEFSGKFARMRIRHRIAWNCPENRRNPQEIGHFANTHLEILNRLIEQTRKIEQTLSATGSIYEQYDFEHAKLFLDTKTALIHIFGEQSRQLDAITTIPTFAYTTRGQQTILKLFRATLISTVDEIREYWDDQTPADMVAAVQEATSTGKSSAPPASYDRTKLFWNIVTYFDMNDIENMCFLMSIEFDNIRGDSRDSKARELIMYCGRNGRARELIAVCQKLRPNVAWLSDATP